MRPAVRVLLPGDVAEQFKNNSDLLLHAYMYGRVYTPLGTHHCADIFGGGGWGLSKIFDFFSD